MNEMWKAYKGQYATDTKDISFKEYESQEAKWSVFIKKKESFLCMTCAYHMNEI